MTVTTRFEEGQGDRLAAFLEYTRLELRERIGRGQEGEVYLLSDGSVVKVHEFQELLAQELRVYRRLRERGVVDVCGHDVPVLLGEDVSLGVLRMLAVERPFVLDFSLATFQKPFFVEDEAALRLGSGLYTAEQVAKVKEIREELWRVAGVWITDVHPGNVAFSEARRG